MTTQATWIIARTPADNHHTYPCQCWLGQRCTTGLPTTAKTCHCWGRQDTDRLPAHCCAVRNPKTWTKTTAAEPAGATR